MGNPFSFVASWLLCERAKIKMCSRGGSCWFLGDLRELTVRRFLWLRLGTRHDQAHAEIVHSAIETSPKERKDGGHASQSPQKIGFRWSCVILDFGCIEY